MSNTTPAINYTNRDFLSIKEALKSHIQVKFPNDWKDFYEASIGIALMDLVAYAFDVISFQTDYTANEVYVETARDRKSVLLLGKLVGYQMGTATSASVICSATLPTSITNTTVIPEGTTVRSTGGVDFVVLEQVTLTPGVVGTVTFVQGTNQQQNFSSAGSSFQKFVLSTGSVIQGTVSVVVDGDDWEEVTSLAYANSTDKNYSVDYDEDGKATILFGDGDSGKVPSAGTDNVIVSYRVGGGVQGNIPLNAINTTVIGKEQIPGTPDVLVAVVNSGATIGTIETGRGSGGEEAETTSHAKLWIPKWTRTNGRAVTEDDYDALANVFSDASYGAPAFAKARLKQEIPELNTVSLACWARDGEGNVTEPSAGLKAAMSEYFNNNDSGAVKCICTHTEVEDGLIVYTDVDVGIKVSTNYVSADVLAAVEDAIEELFSSSDNIPGADFRISLVYNAVQTTAGVDYCILNTLRGGYKTTEVIGVGDGVETSFSDTLTLESGFYIVGNTVTITYGTPATETLSDNGEGVLVNALGVAVGTISYTTGALVAVFASPPADGTLVNCEFRHVIDYQRGESEASGDGITKRFKGSIGYPPINPYNAGDKGIAFSDGTQAIIDDGNGNLTGDIDPAGQNVIDYDTGGYDFTFLIAPADGQGIYSTYRQILDTASQDIPIEKSQLSVKGIITTATL